MHTVLSKDGTKQIPAWYATRSKTGPDAPMDPLKGSEVINKVRNVVKMLAPIQI